jgi:hypothetical protein
MDYEFITIPQIYLWLGLRSDTMKYPEDIYLTLILEQKDVTAWLMTRIFPQDASVLATRTSCLWASGSHNKYFQYYNTIDTITMVI